MRRTKLDRWRLAIRRSELTPTQRHVALEVSYWLDFETADGAFPGNARLAEYTGLGSATITRALKALEGFGWLTATARGGSLSGGQRKATEWAASWPDAEPVIDLRAAAEPELGDFTEGLNDVSTGVGTTTVSGDATPITVIAVNQSPRSQYPHHHDSPPHNTSSCTENPQPPKRGPGQSATVGTKPEGATKPRPQRARRVKMSAEALADHEAANEARAEAANEARAANELAMAATRINAEVEADLAAGQAPKTTAEYRARIEGTR